MMCEGEKRSELLLNGFPEDFLIEEKRDWEIPGDCWNDDVSIDLVGISDQQASFHSCLHKIARNSSGVRIGKLKLRPKDCIRCALWLRAYKATHERRPRNTFSLPQIGAVYVDYIPGGPEVVFDAFSIFMASTAPVQRTPYPPEENLRTDLAISSFPSGYTGSYEALTFIKARLEQCIKSHPLCSKNNLRRFPSRFIDLRNSPHIRLIENTKAIEKYAALSYCWGRGENLKTTSENRHAHMTRISWESLPKTFQDAVDFCRRLEIDFIWIDSLCIIQDSQYDWEVESAKMGDVYGGAFITIAATASKNPSEGCYRANPCPSREIATVKRGEKLVKIFARKQWNHPEDVNDLWGPELVPSKRELFPLYERAWAFQERLMGSRLVQFTQHEVMWTCRMLQTCECTEGLAYKENLKTVQQGRTGAPRAIYDSLSNSGEHATVIAVISWQTIVGNYAGLALSKESDRLPALSGIAAKVGGGLLGRYYAGLWEYQFPLWLCWYINNPGSHENAGSSPSWSWCAVRSKCSWQFTNFHDQRIKLKVTDVSVDCEPTGANEFGQIRDGRVHLKGRLFKAAVGDSRLDTESVSGNSVLLFGTHCEKCVWDHVQQASHISRDWNMLYCLVVAAKRDWTFSLVLRRVDETKSIYRRVGCTVGDVTFQEASTGSIDDLKTTQRYRKIMGVEEPGDFTPYDVGVEQIITII